MKQTLTQSSDELSRWMENISYGIVALSVVVFLIHILKLSTTKDFKTKYDYINGTEIKTLMLCGILLIVAAGFYINSGIGELTLLHLLVRVFLTVSLGLIVGFIIQNLLKFYYPFYIEKRLKALRYKPRISPKTGKPMKLLSEEEEDVYLDEGMQAEEEIFSIDYDVWVDEETGYTKIEKYSGHLYALQCPECNYQTFRVIKEEILKAPSSDEEGELLKHFECGYCAHKAKKNYRIAVLKNLEGQEKAIT